MSKPQLEADEKLIEECNSCGESMLSVYIKDSLCYPMPTNGRRRLTSSGRE